MRGGVLALLFGFSGLFCGYYAAGRWEQSARWESNFDIDSADVALESNVADAAQSPASQSGIRFVDVAPEIAPPVDYFTGAAGEYHIFEATGGGVAVLDYDLDGFFDLAFADGCRITPDLSDRSRPSRLLASRGALEFVDVGDTASAQAYQYGHGASAADFNNDGFTDLLFSGLNALDLLVNNGDGTFRIANGAGVAPGGLGTSTAWADLDADGDLDLYVCNYAETPLEDPHVCTYEGKRLHCDPRNYRPQQDSLFENLGDSTFRDRSSSIDVGDRAGRGFGTAVTDFNGDDRPDLFVANDKSPNLYWVNQGNWKFVEAAMENGCALTGAGEEMAGMGVACGDVDGNGHPDLFVTNFYRAENVLFANQGPLGFVDQTAKSRLGTASRSRLGWGALLLDANLDGYQDLFVANGHVSRKSGEPYLMQQEFHRNTGNAVFEEVTATAGEFFLTPRAGRGTASVDYDNDGLVDVVCTDLERPASVLKNETRPHGNWIGLELVGRTSARDAVGALVVCTAANGRGSVRVMGGGAFLSRSDPRLVLGLSGETSPPELEFRWPGGETLQKNDLSPGAYYLVVEPPRAAP